MAHDRTIRRDGSLRRRRRCRSLPLLFALVLLGAVRGLRADVAEDLPKDSLLIDATWIPCGDSTESLYIAEDGRAIYAWSNSGVSFQLGSSMLASLKGVMDEMGSTIDTAALDSCTTIGVIMAGPRYLLINSATPTEATRALAAELQTLRKYGRRKIDRDIDRSISAIEARVDTTMKTDPQLDPETLRRALYSSPIASTWRCRGTVTVTAQIDSRGSVRRAFVVNANVEGKCASLLVMTALRGVLLSTFQPGEKEGGKAGAAWMNVVVRFGRE